ncbi:peptide-methionine (S)-S-oxide reductase, partial [Microbacterium flavum]|uniref:peptide-methionine (S)-S-oxide reductase n=1 Tax=Microbacterium flavum TaxID=415216 RepID=UPI0024AE2709
RRVRRPRLREHPQRPLTHLRRILPVHRVPSLLEERNESQADSQAQVARDTIADVNASGLWPGEAGTTIEPAGPFWEAEPEHQNYLERYPNGFNCHFPRAGWVLPPLPATASV